MSTPSARRRGAGWGWVALALVLVIGAVGAIGYGFYQHARALYEGPGPASAEGAPRVALIPAGANAAQIGAVLAQAGAVRSARHVTLAARWRGDGAALKAGEYEIPAGASLKAVLDLLVSGRVIEHALTIPEGWTTAQALNAIAAAPFLEGPTPETAPEGSLLPDTYRFTRGVSRAAALARMQQALADLLAEAWPKRAADLPLAAAAEAVILASIVEKETGLAEERPMVASVFVNRLRLGMRLQSDPTIIYGITGGAPLGRGLRRSEIDRPTAYNTYQIDRLPPTPIANPGRAAILAVLNPPPSEALFFVADGTGGHAFAKTNAEHAANVRRWRQIERGLAP